MLVHRCSFSFLASRLAAARTAFASMPRIAPAAEASRSSSAGEHQGRTLKRRQRSEAGPKIEPLDAGVRSGSYGDRPADCECPPQPAEAIRRGAACRDEQPGQDRHRPVDVGPSIPQPKECLLCQILRGRPIVRPGQGEPKDRQPGCRVSRLESAGMRIGQTRGEPQRLASAVGLGLGAVRSNASHRTVHVRASETHVATRGISQGQRSRPKHDLHGVGARMHGYLPRRRSASGRNRNLLARFCSPASPARARLGARPANESVLARPAAASPNAGRAT